ncbi:MAG: 50S ribosomal protein L17, partial [Planctomycetota bacterium]
QHGAIRTTESKAKELRRFVERMISAAKTGTLHARRRVLAEMGDRAMTDDDGTFLDKSVVQKLFDEVAPRYADRPGGYTRIIRLDEQRIGDAGTQVILQLVEEDSSAAASGGTSRRKDRAAKRHEAASAISEQIEDEEPAEVPAEASEEELEEPSAADQPETEPEAADEQEGDAEVEAEEQSGPEESSQEAPEEPESQDPETEAKE